MGKNEDQYPSGTYPKIARRGRLGVQLRAQREAAKRLTAAAVSCNALLGGALLVEDIVGALASEGLTETKLTAG